MFSNHIIIPIVANKSSPKDPQSKKINFTLTPSKSQNCLSTWKKTTSAFKKFKQPKGKIPHLQLNSNILKQQEKSNQYIFKLAKKRISEHEDGSELMLLQFMQPSCGYYDPNDAPLFQLDTNFSLTIKERKIQGKDFSDDQFYLDRKESSDQDIEINHNKIQIRPDDVFIIIRKENIKKYKQSKHKFIRKERSFKQSPEEKVSMNSHIESNSGNKQIYTLNEILEAHSRNVQNHRRNEEVIQNCILKQDFKIKSQN